jgi:hypothetical protein
LKSCVNLKLGQKGQLFLILQTIAIQSLVNYRQWEDHHFGF